MGGWHRPYRKEWRDGGKERALPEPNRAPAGDARPPDPADPAMGPAARVRDQRGDPEPLGRVVAGGYRLAVSGAAPPGKAEVGEVRMADFGKQAAREVLSTDSGGKETTFEGEVQVVAAFGCDCRRVAAGGIEEPPGVKHEFLAPKKRTRRA